MRIPEKDLAFVDFASGRSQIPLKQDSPRAYLHLANAKQLLELNMDEEALEEIRSAIREFPRYADAYYELGKYWEKQGQVDRALEYYNRAITIDPGRPGMAKQFLEVAEMYFKKGDLKVAAETYYSLFLHFPGDKSAEYAGYRAGLLFAEKLKDNKKALAALEGAIAKFPKSQYAEQGNYELGRIYAEESSLDAAEATLLRFVSNYPSSQWIDDAHYMLAKVYLRKRQNDKAMQEILKVMGESKDTALVDEVRRLLDECAWIVYSVPDGLPGDVVRAIAVDENYIWVGTSAGVARFDLKANSFTGEELLKGEDIRVLAADATYLWVGTLNSGIKRYNKREKTMLDTGHPASSIQRPTSISIDSSSVWVGTASGGVYQYSKYDDKWTKYTMQDGLPSDNIISIVSTSNGVWCGTMKKGASVFDNSTGRWQGITDPAMSGDKTVTSIAAGSNLVWFAWKENLRNGVSRYDASAKSWKDWVIAEWEVFKPGAQDDSNTINLGADDRGMWVGTGDEVLFFDHASSSWSSPFSYPSELAGQVPVYVLVEDNSVWFATSRGLGRLDKNLINQIGQIRAGP